MFGSIGGVTVVTTSGRGQKPEEVAERALDKLIHVGENAPPELRQQAEAYRDDIRKVLVYYMYEAIRSHNVTVAVRLTNAGYPELTTLLDE